MAVGSERDEAVQLKHDQNACKLRSSVVHEYYLGQAATLQCLQAQSSIALLEHKATWHTSRGWVGSSWLDDVAELSSFGQLWDAGAM
jgi:hypothetical protein